MPPLLLGNAVFDFSRAYIVGVLNVTPDSFSDGGHYEATAAAIARGRELAEAGADIIDVGGESTRPGAGQVSAAEEIDRVCPVIEGLAAANVPISIDTTKASVVAAAYAAGAMVANDVSGGRFDPELIPMVVRTGMAYVLGHLRGDSIAAVHSADAQKPTAAEVEEELGGQRAALPSGLAGRVILDPGLGFGKGLELNLELTRNSGRLAAALQCPVMIGPSRKRYLGALTGHEVADRDDATIGAALAAVANGAHFVRVHAVERVRPALTVFEAVFEASIRRSG